MPDASLSPERLKELFMGRDETTGLIEDVLGFRTATEKYQTAHLMNDLLQSTLGGRPQHRGDHLCRVIRRDKLSEEEDNSDAALRADEKMGAAYASAFPAELGDSQIERLRAAAGLILNFDGCMFKQGQSMTSGVAAHWTLLGAEGFRRFGLGRYIWRILGESGRARLSALLQVDRDPVSQALAPLLWSDELRPDKEVGAYSATPFDEALGRHLTILLQQPLSKPTLLRLVALASTLGIILKILGAGRPGGRPAVLALPEEHSGGRRPLRQEAVQSLQRGIEALDQLLAELCAEHPLGATLWKERPAASEPSISVQAGSLATAGPELVQHLNDLSADKKNGIWTPSRFLIAMGRHVDLIRPPTDRAGWGKYLILPPDLLEALVLMFVPAGAPARSWRSLWGEIAESLGLIIGANLTYDAQTLRDAGVLHINYQHLAENSNALLALAVQQGVARRLPDSGAEAGGELL